MIFNMVGGGDTSLFEVEEVILNFKDDSVYWRYYMQINTKNPTSKLIGGISECLKSFDYMPILLWNNSSRMYFRTSNQYNNWDSYSASVSLNNKMITLTTNTTSPNMTYLNGQKIYLVFRK